jgi:hypothetical protein
MTILIFINTLLLLALLAQRRRKEQPCNLQHAAALQRIERNIMGLKEDHAELQGKMGNIEEAAQLIADDVTALKDELKEANERANIDLTPLVARADNIAARLSGIAGPNAGSDPAASPTGEGEGTGGGVTGDGE